MTGAYILESQTSTWSLRASTSCLKCNLTSSNSSRSRSASSLCNVSSWMTVFHSLEFCRPSIIDICGNVTTKYATKTVSSQFCQIYSKCLKSGQVWISDTGQASGFETVRISDIFDKPRLILNKKLYLRKFVFLKSGRLDVGTQSFGSARGLVTYFQCKSASQSFNPPLFKLQFHVNGVKLNGQHSCFLSWISGFKSQLIHCHKYDKHVALYQVL